MKQKILSLTLCVAMLLSMLTVCIFPASAETYGDLTYFVLDGEVTIADCDVSASGTLTIPATLGGYPVKHIGNNAFDFCDNLTDITIPEGVTSIGVFAFRSCSGLTSITIPEGVTSIGERAFAGCTGLTGIIIPKGVTRIDKSAFTGCNGLKSITIPDSLMSIGCYAFYDTAYYNDLNNWENDVLYIGNHLIDAKLSIAGSYTVKAGTLTIGGYAFGGHTGLTDITIPKSVTHICEEAFLYCENLKSVTIPEGVTSIGEDAFNYCDALQTVWYGGDEATRKAMNIGEGNQWFENATWYYSSYVDVSKKFTDVHKKDWYYKAVEYAVNNNLFSGLTETEFGPNENMTRGMFVTVLGRLAGAPNNNKVTIVFTDVKKGQYYTAYVKWANENGIVSGTSATTFGPNANITREQICAMMVRYCSYAKITLQKKNAAITFKDGAKISKFARSAVKACQQGGIVNGEKVSGGYNFRPQGNATRAEVATIMMNFAKAYK